MKNYIPFIVLLLGIRGYSQCIKTQISTDPDNPINSERPSMLNTFDWTQEWFDLDCDNINDNQIQSPFFQPNNVNINHFKESKNRLPKDGWELIHYDLGFNLSSGSVDYPYFVLYNRYTGTMRVFVAIARVNDHTAAQFKVYFLSDNKTHLLSTGNTLLPIDNLIVENPSLVSPAPFLNSDKMWFYADFTMMYDPCTCEANSKLVIKIDLIDYAKVDIQGETTGTLVAIEDKQGTVKDDASAAVDPKDLADVWKKGQKTYKDISKFAKDQEKALKIEGKTDFELELEGLYDKLAKRHSLNDFQEAIKSNKFLQAGLKAAPYIGAATALVDLFIGGGQESSGPQEVKLTPMSINLNSTYKGTIITDYPYKTIIFNTPGTSNSDIIDDDEYPIYNHSLGVFNLLETPDIEYLNKWKLNNDCQGYCFDESVWKYFRATSELKYVLNPATGFEENPEVFFCYVFTYESPIGDTAIYKHVLNEFLDKEGLIVQDDDTTFRTQFLPTESFNDVVAKFYANNHWGYLSECKLFNIKKVYLKLLVNLKRKDADENTQNVLFVGKYPVNIINSDKETNDQFWNTSIVGISNETSKKDVTVSESLKAWNKITLDNVQVQPVSTIDIIANEVNLLSGTIIKPGSTIKGGVPNGIQYGSISPVSLSSVDCSKYKSALLKSASISVKNAEINLATTIQENTSNFVSVYPNPASDFFEVLSNNVPINSLKILNSTGTTIYLLENISRNHVHINTSNYQKGLYIIQINFIDGGLINKKILKQ